MIFFVTSFNGIISSEKSYVDYTRAFSLSQDEPFYFYKPIPAKIKLLNQIDLSFFRNQSVVTQYRYRLEIPNGVATAIDRNFTRWSPWISFDFIEIIIPMLDQEGGYKLIVEYRTSKSSEILKFEKLFYVYRVNLNVNIENAKTKTMPVNDNTAAKITPVTEKPVTKASPAMNNTAPKITLVTENTAKNKMPVTDKAITKAAPMTYETAKRTIPVIDKLAIKTTFIDILSPGNIRQTKESRNDKQTPLKDAKDDITLKAATSSGNNTAELSKEPVTKEIINATDYNKLLAYAIEKKDIALFIESIQNGAGIGIKGVDGGNIFHLMNDTISSEELISVLKNKGISLNETDNNGNSPLHVAILAGEGEYARSLINQGADLNIKNKLGLSPLHLAAFLNEKEVANQLLQKGAEIDIKGNSGYTPLHIASELNHVELAKDLLYMGAKPRIKTDQKLTPKAIAKIQNNIEMTKLIAKKGSYTLNLPISNSTRNTTLLNSVKLSPKYDFNLPYDKEFVRKRQFSKVVQFISVPVFALSAVGMTYLKSEANHYYSLSKIAETEDMAKAYYKKANKYDTNTYISGGISLVSVYGFIHSTIRKKNISNKMYKTFNYAFTNY
jgi:ankyrin repeat protein